ncbi:MAG: RNA 2',3'-cyclic phosphodiesterase [Sedimentisphaerales bacterium]|nr:RNA 2',3'-cyclic phosphodiesterase [Sedimentisphaerales bacterium]
MTIRCFIAVELEQAVQQQLGKVQESLRKQLCKELGYEPHSIKWVVPENIHLTLKFLGDIDDSAVGEVCTAVKCAAEGITPFDISIGGLGCFPPNKPTRILWAGLAEPSPSLMQLQKSVDHELTQIGFPPEHRGFSCHFTLARIRQLQLGRDVQKLISEQPPSNTLCQEVAEITIFQSELTRQGSIYTPMQHVALGR